jgi:hypothetical protein
MILNRMLEALSNPTRRLFVLFLLATLMINLVSDGITEFLWQWIGDSTADQPRWQQGVLRLGLLLGLLLLIYLTDIPLWIKSLLYRTGLLTAEEPQARVRPLTQTYPGLIVAMSLSNDSPAEAAIRHHWHLGQSPHLRHCWLICTDKSLPYADQMVSRLAAEGITQSLKVYYGRQPLVDSEPAAESLSLLVPDDLIDDPNYIQRLVDAIYTDAAPQVGLSPTEIIADYTGATKGMTAGILLACATPDRPLQYISQIYPDQIMTIDVSYRIKPIRRRR